MAKKKRILYDFYADWCGPCRRNAPVIDELEEEGVTVKRINIDRSPKLTSKYKITSIPVYIKIENAEEVERTQDIDKVKSWKKWLLK